MEYARFGRPKSTDDPTALKVKIIGDPKLLLQAAKNQNEENVRDAFKGIKLEADGAVYTLDKVNNFGLGAHSYTATFKHGGKKLFVKVPKPAKPPGSSGRPRIPQAAPMLPERTVCDVVATSIAAPARKDITEGIQIMEMGQGDFFDAMSNQKLKPGDETEAVRWMYETAACVLETGLVATDWKWENIAVMSYSPLTLRLIDVDSFYALADRLTGQCVGTPAGLMPVGPLAAPEDSSLYEKFRAQMVLTMAWTVVVNAVNIKAPGNTAIFMPNGRQWTEALFFERVQNLYFFLEEWVQHANANISLLLEVWPRFAHYWTAYEEYDKGGWTSDDVQAWTNFVIEAFKVQAEVTTPRPEEKQSKRLRVLIPEDEGEKRRRAIVKDFYGRKAVGRRGYLSEDSLARAVSHNKGNVEDVRAGFADLCV